MPQPLSVLNLFATFATREEYEAKTGKPCPAWDPKRQPKAWEDPDAHKVLVVGQVSYMLYDRIFVALSPQGDPVWDSLGLPVGDAKTVNIPPRGEGQTNVPGADQPEVPCPLRELADDEVLKAGFGNVPQVFKSAELVSIDVGFTQVDRDLLIKIAAKLGA